MENSDNYDWSTLNSKSKNQNQSWQDDKDPNISDFYKDPFKIQSFKDESRNVYDLSHDISPANPTSSTCNNYQGNVTMHKKNPIVLGLSKSNKMNVNDKTDAKDEKSSSTETSNVTKPIITNICFKCGIPGHTRAECKDPDFSSSKHKAVTPKTFKTARSTVASSQKSMGGRPIESRITRVQTLPEVKTQNTQQYLCPVQVSQLMPEPPKIVALPGGLGFSYPKGVPKSFLRAPTSTPLMTAIYAANKPQNMAAQMSSANHSETSWTQNMPQGSPTLQSVSGIGNPNSEVMDGDNAGDTRAYSPSDLYMENTVNEEYVEEEDLDFLENQAGQKRQSAFERLGPLTQPKKPKLTINLQWNKEESVREVVDESKEQDEKKYTPVHLRPEILGSTDEMVKKFTKSWPWAKEVKVIKSVTSRVSRTVMMMEKEQMEEIYKKETTWMQITATGYPSSWNKEMVLDTILDAVKGKSFIPCFISFTATECKFLVIRCVLALTTLHKIRFFVRKDDVDIFITISQTTLSVNQFDFIPKLVLRKRLSMVYREEGSLDLSQFTVDDIVSNFIYFPLNNITNQTELISGYGMCLDWANLTVLNLSHNRITSLSGFEFHIHLPKLRHLDLSHNYLEKVTLLLRYRNMGLHSIKLEGNPLCMDYIDPQHYIHVLRTLFPLLKEIDGIPIQRRGQFPKIKRNYCTGDAVNLIGKFLDVYFPLVDAEDENRKSVVDLYHMKASMTITYKYKMRQAPIFKICRSLFHSNRMIQEGNMESVDGAVNISKVINKWPPMIHDPLTFTVDQMHHDNYVTIFKITGVLKIVSNLLNADECLVAFGRTFVLHSYDGYEYRITNDMVYWDIPTSALSSTAFVTEPVKPRNLNIMLESPPDDDLKERFTEIFMNLTEMNKDASQRCLQQWNWNLKRAVEYFMELLNMDELHISTDDSKK